MKTRHLWPGWPPLPLWLSPARLHCRQCAGVRQQGRDRRHVRSGLRARSPRTRSRTKSVKDFAQKMIDDHGAANAKLESIAGEQKLKVPSELDASTRPSSTSCSKPRRRSIRPYVEMQRSAHTDAVGLFEAYAKDGDNATLKSFAQETLPTLKMHQDMIEKIATTTGTASAATSSTTPTVTVGDTTRSTPSVSGREQLHRRPGEKPHPGRRLFRRIDADQGRPGHLAWSGKQGRQEHGRCARLQGQRRCRHELKQKEIKT